MEPRRYVRVREPLGDQEGYLPFGFGQLGRRRGATADPGQFGAGARHPWRCAESLEHLFGVNEGLAGSSLLPTAPEPRPQPELAARRFEGHGEFQVCLSGPGVPPGTFRNTGAAERIVRVDTIVLVESRHLVVLLPGGVLPADPAYAALLEVLGERVDAVAKDLEVYSGDRPLTEYSLGMEVEGVLREADGHGFDRFHLVGYSGGGASSLSFAAQHSERLLSLALLEPAWAGNEKTREEEALWLRFRALERLPRDQFMAGFVRLQLAPGVEPPLPPRGPPPAWMAKRPAGIRALIDAFDSGDLDMEALRAFDRPVYFALGGRSNPDYYARIAGRLATIFPDFTVETFPERHHFDPPHRIEPERLADSLLGLWQRAEA
jgi:pimeloyl-ACP methyl ester carboxylesterase